MTRLREIDGMSLILAFRSIRLWDGRAGTGDVRCEPLLRSQQSVERLPSCPSAQARAWPSTIHTARSTRQAAQRLAITAHARNAGRAASKIRPTAARRVRWRVRATGVACPGIINGARSLSANRRPPRRNVRCSNRLIVRADLGMRPQHGVERLEHVAHPCLRDRALDHDHQLRLVG
jgi:hypothetical protein